MKKKILISLVTCFLAAGSFVHYNFAQNDHNMDFSLADISVMAQADGESGDCNLCVVKNIWGTIKFSCKPLHGTNNCSTSAAGHTLSCDNATEEGCT